MRMAINVSTLYLAWLLADVVMHCLKKTKAKFDRMYTTFWTRIVSFQNFDVRQSRQHTVK